MLPLLPKGDDVAALADDWRALRSRRRGAPIPIGEPIGRVLDPTRLLPGLRGGVPPGAFDQRVGRDAVLADDGRERLARLLDRDLLRIDRPELGEARVGVDLGLGRGLGSLRSGVLLPPSRSDTWGYPSRANGWRLGRSPSLFLC
jgi:hypothetical protein